MAQAYRQTRTNAKTKIQGHTGESMTPAEYKDMVRLHGGAAIVVVLADTVSEIGGTRCAEYTGTISAGNKATIGLTRTSNGITKDVLPVDIYNQYRNSNSYVIHEGYSAGANKGKLAFSEGKVYHFPCSGANTDDFTNFQEMVEQQIAYQFLQSSGTTAQANAALAAYNTLKDALS